LLLFLMQILVKPFFILCFFPFVFFLKVRSATCWITECRLFVALLISEVVKFISSFKKLSSLFLIFGFKNPFVKSYPHDPLIRGSFFKINKEYAKLRKYKKKQFRQQIIDKLDTFQSNNQKEYWNLVNSLSEYLFHLLKSCQVYF
jgi:hypothetical protein